MIECNSQKLASQKLHLGTAFGQAVKALFPTKRIAVVQTSTKDELCADLAKAFKEYGRFRTILIVGHSSVNGLMLTSEGCYPWAVVGRWLERFQPEFLFFAACEAGRSAAVRDVFGSVGSSLQQIYASPVTLYKIDTAPLGVLLYMLLARGKINSEQSTAIRVGQYIASGGQLYRWRRNETGPGQELIGALWDAVGDALNLGPWNLFKNLFR